MDGMDCDPSVADLPLSDPVCVKAMECCTAFYAGENASQTATPFAGQSEYGRWTTYYWVVLLALVAVYHAIITILDRRTRRRGRSSDAGLFEKAQALGRTVTYRATRGTPLALVSWPRTGSIAAVLLLSIVVITAFVFAERPYYRPQFGFGSPPIAIRSGFIAFACVPILVALAGKANAITFLTGIGHEKLVVAHQWVAWISFVLSLIHTIPFFIASFYEPGDGGYERVKSEFYRKGSAASLTEYSGVPPLAILFGLCILSLPPIRHRFYESFYAVHILLAITYVGLLFWHAGDELDSWAYLWATVAIWLASWFARLFWFNQSLHVRGEWFKTLPATLTVLPGDLVRIEVERPRDMHFQPAQHCFLRIPTISWSDNHPFTIASAACSDAPRRGSDRMLFLVKARDGFTRKLRDHGAVDKSVDVSVCLEGPYGGLARPLLAKRYDKVLLIAGGSGISACLSWLSQLASSAEASRLQQVTLLWAIRDEHSIAWVSNELREAKFNGRVEVDIRIHITGLAASPQVEHDEKAQIDGPFDQSSMIFTTSTGRPDLSTAVLESTGRQQSTCVFVCGPEGMNVDASNACSSAQKLVLGGKARSISLHVETFGW
ncbi:hypothetical protein JX266_006102 [Neoarthrinium moseri]|nr:hypothetical protein JX266_006102 [Neoarthrinium moseri]